jgi:4-aminobutyrate aminotransferase
LVARADVMDWPPGSHASTFGGNPVACRAALATLDLLEREFMANAIDRGKQLLSGLVRLVEKRHCLSHARGLGLMVAVDIVDRHGRADHDRREQIIETAFHHGLLLLGCGKAAVRFSPALCVTEEQVDSALTLFDEVCRA